MKACFASQLHILGSNKTRRACILECPTHPSASTNTHALATALSLTFLQPLPTGRLLTREDVSPALAGRQAELFWPDDAKWYLIQFNAIYTETGKAE